MRAVVKEIDGGQHYGGPGAGPYPEHVVGWGADVVESAERLEGGAAKQRTRRTAAEHAGTEVFTLEAETRRQQHRRRATRPMGAAREGEARVGVQIETGDQH